MAGGRVIGKVGERREMTGVGFSRSLGISGDL